MIAAQCQVTATMLILRISLIYSWNRVRVTTMGFGYELSSARRAPAPRSRRSASAAWACRACTARPTGRESIATIHAALDAGITLLDTGDFYGMGHNEMLIGEALQGRAARPAVCQRQVRRPARSGRRLARLRRAAGGGEELPRLYAAAARRRPHRHLPPGAARSRRADRGHGRRHRRHGEGRLCPPHRPVGGRAGHHPPRARRCIRSATCRSSTR